MIEEAATVKSVKEQSVKVLTTKSSACNQCSEADSCSTSVLAKFFGNKEIELQLFSDVPLKIGDEVLLGIEETVFIRLTVLIYFLPLCSLLIFATLGQFVVELFDVSNESPVILGAMIGFASCYFAIKFYIKHYFGAEKINPVILKKL
ncbi:MAG: SoxR reducing system RseC family protein [Cycloclasticus sp.]